MNQKTLNQTASWLGDLDEASIRQVEKIIADELRRRNPPRVSPEVQHLIDQLRCMPVGEVAKRAGRSRQRLYRICKKHGIEPVRRQSKKTAS